jgi:membrane protein DedA with SNARE-associated domain
VNLAELIQTYGYLALAVGTFFEGEAVLLLAGFAVQRGYMSLGDVILVAMAASVVGDQIYYHLGRSQGPRLLRRFPSLQSGSLRMSALIRRYQVPESGDPVH